MKRKLLVFLALLISLLCALALVSCKDEEEAPAPTGTSTGTPSSSEPEEETVLVVFDYNYDGATDEEVEIEMGKSLGSKFPAAPSRVGYVFAGWYASDDTEYAKEYTKYTKIESDITLVAKWDNEPPCDHSMGYKTIGYTVLSCTTDHKLVKKCRNPRCGDMITTLIEPKLDHDLKDYTIEPSCYKNGLKITKCQRDGCTYRVEQADPNAPATGNHVYTDWMITLAPTNYAYGEKRQACTTVGCVAGITDRVEPLNVQEYYELDIKTVSHGDKKYVNISEIATAYATSLYRLTTAANVLDAAPATYWRADTLVDSETYTGDQLTVEFLTEYEIKNVELVVPNYYGWALGEQCTVKYDVEMYLDGVWTKVGEISDSDNRDPKSQKVTVALELPEPKTTSKIRFTVTQASRYTPAMICEVQVYGYVGNDQVIRAPQSIAPLATPYITGSYNAWVDSSAANLLDNKTQSSWCTDARVWWQEPIYGKYKNDITNWSVEYGINDIQNGVNSTKTVGNVVVKTGKVIPGETIEVWVCRVWNEQVMQNVLIQSTDEEGNPLFDEEGNPIMETVTDAEGNPMTEPKTEPVLDGNGNPVYDTEGNPVTKEVWTEKSQWYSFGVQTVQEGDSGVYTFTPVWKDSEGKDQTSAISGITMVRVEVDNYGADENRDDHYITSVTINENGTDTPYNNLEFTYRRKVYASFTFPTSQFVAYLQITCDSVKGREMSLQKWVEDSSEEDGGYWQEITRLTVGDVSSSYAKFTVDIGEYVTGLRLEVTKESARYGAYINDVIPYTIAEMAQTLVENTSCPHKYADTEPIEVVAPTCTTAGYSVYKCRTCDVTWKTDAIDRAGHKWDQGTETMLNRNKVRKHECDACDATKTVVTEYRTDDTQNPYLSVPKVTKYFRNAPASWSMTFDDGNYIDTYEWVYPELAKRHMVATAVVTVQYASGYITDWTKYVNSGAFDLGSHSSFHAANFTESEINETVMMSEIDDAFFTIMSWVPGQRVLGFATPNGSTGAGTAYFVNDLMLGGRSGGQAGTYCDPDTLTTREAWGNLPSYITYATTTFGKSSSEREGVDYKGAIDYIVEKGLWTADCIHTIYTDAEDINDIASDKFSVNKFVFLEKLDYFIEKGVWVSSYTQALQYFREAHAVSIENMTIGATNITFDVTDGLDDIMFVQPLTFEFTLPSGWTDVVVTQNGVDIPVVANGEYAPNTELDMMCTIKDGVLYFDAIPDAGTVMITKK